MVTMRSSSVSASSTDMNFSKPDDDSEELEELDSEDDSDSEELVEEDVLVDSDDSVSVSVWDELDNRNMFTPCKISWMNVWRSETVGIKLQLYLIKHVDVLL